MRAENWKATSAGGKIVGRCDLFLDSGMIIRGVTLVNGSKGQFVGVPQSSWTARDGTKKYSPIIEFVDDARASKFLAAALDAVVALAEGRSEERAA